MRRHHRVILPKDGQSAADDAATILFCLSFYTQNGLGRNAEVTFDSLCVYAYTTKHFMTNLLSLCALRRRPRLARVLALGVALALVLAMAISAGGTHGQTSQRLPMISSTAMFSAFAREHGLVPQSFPQQSIAGSAGANASLMDLLPITAGTDVRVNQDFSRRPQNDTTIAVNPFSTNMLVGAASDYRLGAPGGAAFYTSYDLGLSWNDGLLPYPLFVSKLHTQKQLVEVPFASGSPAVDFGRSRPGSAQLPAGLPVAYLAYLSVSASFCEHGIFLSRSTDGRNWTRPVVPSLQSPRAQYTPVYWDQPEHCTTLNDKPSIAVDRTGGPHNGRVYVTWTRFIRIENFTGSVIVLSYSDNNGETFSTPIEVNGSSAALCGVQVHGPAGPCDESQFSSTVVGPDGSVYIAFINQQRNGFRDGFRSQYLLTKFNPDTLALNGPYHVSPLLDGDYDLPRNSLGQPTLCNSNFRFNAFGNLALDPSDTSGNTMYIVFADNRNGSRFPFPANVSQSPPDSFGCPLPSYRYTDTDVFLAKSTNGGVTWQSAVRVNQDPLRNRKDQWFPHVTVAPTGRIDIVFFDRRDDFSNRLAHTYFARSSDRGATWSEIQLSDAQSNISWASEKGESLGDSTLR